MGARCLQNKPQIQWMQAICGNGKLENGEICDCGTEEVSVIARKIDE